MNVPIESGKETSPSPQPCCSSSAASFSSRNVNFLWVPTSLFGLFFGIEFHCSFSHWKTVDKFEAIFMQLARISTEGWILLSLNKISLYKIFCQFFQFKVNCGFAWQVCLHPITYKSFIFLHWWSDLSDNILVENIPMIFR